MMFRCRFSPCTVSCSSPTSSKSCWRLSIDTVPARERRLEGQTLPSWRQQSIIARASHAAAAGEGERPIFRLKQRLIYPLRCIFGGSGCWPSHLEKGSPPWSHWSLLSTLDAHMSCRTQVTEVPLQLIPHLPSCGGLIGYQAPV